MERYMANICWGSFDDFIIITGNCEFRIGVNSNFETSIGIGVGI